ncbi:MAG: TIGR02206 family membrane protein [Oscillospiraceae bacterium]|nr:TIGR02206 family membrane protein [Oscillospiraceae bacterium]
MDRFFAFEDAFSPSEGFALFGGGHIIWLAGALICALAGGALYRRCTAAGRRRFDRIFGAVLLALEAAYNALLFFGGNLTVYMLPLHLCALSVFICVIYCFTHVRWMGQYMYYLGMPGALCAMLFPDWSRYPLLNYFCISGFVIHSMLVIYGYALLRSGQVRPDMRGLLSSAAFTVAAAVPLYFLDRATGANYMFLLRPSEGSPLEPLAALTGQRLYLLGFFALFAAVELALYLPWGISRRAKRGRRSV